MAVPKLVADQAIKLLVGAHEAWAYLLRGGLAWEAERAFPHQAATLPHELAALSQL
jgi:hypothetical protein